MENQKKKCSYKEHKNIDATLYCIECKIFICDKCVEYHKGLFENHSLFGLNKNIQEIFTGFCNEANHTNELEYFCRTHNKLCCIACITKIKGEGKGQHTDCNVCFIKDIKDEKRNKLKENIKYLEDLSKSLEDSLNKLKNIFDKINKDKENIKIKIQKLFTKLRNTLNKREDQLLFQVEKQFEVFNIHKDIIKKNENLPNEVKLSLEKGKLIDKKWDDKNNKLNSLINDCINIENNIKDINELNYNIKKSNPNEHTRIKFIPEEEDEINKFIETIKTFGDIYYNDFKYKLKKCPKNINENRKYIINGEKESIVVKIGEDNQFTGVMCDDELENNKIHKWKINILQSKNNLIMVGVAPIDFDVNSSTYNTYGWYFYCYNSTLYSGQPHNYNNKKTNLGKIKNELIVIMDMFKGSLKFIINNEDKGDSYNKIPLDKPLVPIILLYDKNDSIEIIEC